METCIYQGVRCIGNTGHVGNRFGKAVQVTPIELISKLHSVIGITGEVIYERLVAFSACNMRAAATTLDDVFVIERPALIQITCSVL